MHQSFRIVSTWLLMLLLCCCAIGAADAAIFSENGQSGAVKFLPAETGLSGRVAVLVDEKGEETPDSVARAAEDRFSSLQAPFSAGYTRSVHWLRITLAGGQGRRFLVVGPAYLDDLRLYTPDVQSPSGFREHASGDLLPFVAREIPHRNFVFDLKLPEDGAPYTIYLRLKTNSTSMASLSFYTPQAFSSAAYSDYLDLGIQLGALCLILLYLLLHWHLLRERYLALLICLVFSILVVFLGISGLAAEFIFPEQPKLAHLFAPMGSALCMLFGLWFPLEFFNAWRRYPISSRLCIAVMMIAVIALPGAVFDYYLDIAPILVASTLLCLPFYFFILWGSRRLKIFGGNWVFLACGYYYLVVGGNLLAILGIAPEHSQGYGYKATIYLLFMTIAISTRIREIERARDQAIASSVAAEMKAEIAKAKHDEKDKALSLMAHELKTPLAIIDAAVQALGHVHEPKNPNISQRHQRIREAVARLNTLLEDSLNIIRDEAFIDNLKSQREEILLASLENSLKENYSSRLSRLRFNFEVIDNCYGNAMLLRLALGNLVDNAFKYSEQDKVIEVSALRVKHRDKTGVAFEVASAFNGPREEDCEAWFAKYSRGRKSEHKEGLGLGLYLVRSIAEAHGGNAYCEFRPSTDESSTKKVVATLWIPVRTEIS